MIRQLLYVYLYVLFINYKIYVLPLSIKGDWVGSYDCHVQPDWVLIYTINNKNNTVTFERTGSHSEILE